MSAPRPAEAGRPPRGSSKVAKPHLFVTLYRVAMVGAAALTTPALVTAVPVVGAPAAGEWAFRVLLDDKPIGEHRFTLSTQGEQRQLHSVASFDVKFLGFSAYRYRLDVTEQWQGDCLTGLSATTDDDGKRSKVRARSDGGNKLRIDGTGGEQSVEGCLMTFAYWNPALRTQTRLLDPQTGRLESVRIAVVGQETIALRGQPTPATRVRIDGPKQPIDIWYSEQGDWLALQSIVAGGRKLVYRRQ
jgi:Family of unknown function (DUF6134)